MLYKISTTFIRDGAANFFPHIGCEYLVQISLCILIYYQLNEKSQKRFTEIVDSGQSQK